ncbi:MAG: hypothetical protein M3O09_03575 [Acidobacteriota bacterium]|nr:hypothetical protein [Acidobacteriota bacterium]
MRTSEEDILRILSDATEPLFPSEITDSLNRELNGKSVYTMTQVVMRLQKLGKIVVQVPDGRWTLKQRMV